MSQLLAKPILKNKFWIVESQGTKIATIQAIDNGGVVYVDQNLSRSQYPTIKILSKEHNVQFDKKISKNTQRRTYENGNTVYGYPVDQKPHNPLWNVKYQFPVYTKSSKSKSFFCAGHYAIKINGFWSV
ncbi:MAG: hypothetical protein EBZ58_13925, partial [Bacteroidetes bacterium]|nr:hypothetical protein [Bacteroidota bacterium]